MINSFSYRDRRAFQSREMARQENEAFMLLVIAALYFAHLSLLAHVISSLKIPRIFVKSCLICFTLMLLFIATHATSAFAVMNVPAKHVPSDNTSVIMMYGTHVHKTSFPSQERDDVEPSVSYISALPYPVSHSTGKVSFYAALLTQDTFLVSTVRMPSVSASIVLALLAKSYLIGLTFIVAQHDLSSMKVRKKHEKLALIVDAHEASYHVDEIIDLDDDALSMGWLVSGSSPPETSEVERSDEDTPLVAGAILILVLIFCVSAYAMHCRLNMACMIDGQLSARLIGRIHVSRFMHDRYRKVRPPRGRTAYGWYLMRSVDARGRRTYFLRIIESVRPDELYMAVLHIKIENQAGNIVPVFRVIPHTRCQVRFIHDGSPVGNDFIRCRGQGIRVREIDIDEDVLYVRLNCRKF